VGSFGEECAVVTAGSQVATRTRNTLAVRARTISPAFWTSDDVCDLPSDSHRIMFEGLWAYADREGRMLDEPGRIGRRVRAWDPKGAPALIDELVRRGMARRYEADGKRCLWLPAFKKWQRVHPHEAQSYLPTPPDHGDPPPIFVDDIECDDIENIDEEIPKQASDQVDVFECQPEPSEPSEPSVKGLVEFASANVDREALELQLDEPDAPPASVAVVFGHWKQVMRSPRSKCDKKRRGFIEARLRDGFSVDDLKRAVDGCALDPFSMGQNENGKPYRGINVICRDAEHVEKFMGYVDKPPTNASVKGRTNPNEGIIRNEATGECVVCGAPAVADIADGTPGCQRHVSAWLTFAETTERPWERATEWIQSQREGAGAAA
jgi:hypothetical protein